MPHVPSIDIRSDGIDTIMMCYVKTYEYLHTNLIKFKKNIKINMGFLEIFLHYLKYTELEGLFTRTHNTKKYKHCMSSDSCAIELWELDNLMNVEIKDPIRIGSIGWKQRYYEHYFGTYTIRDELCKNYLDILWWATQYYFIGCPAWNFQYNYLYAPYISDVATYVSEHAYDLNNIIFDMGNPLTPLEQLLAIVPPKMSQLLPISYRPLTTSKQSPIIKYYPVDFEIDMLGFDLLWLCIPIIPTIETELIKSTVIGLELTENEKKRNSLLENIII